MARNHGTDQSLTQPFVLRTLADSQPFALTAFCESIRTVGGLRRGLGAYRDTPDSTVRPQLTCQQCGRRPERLVVGFEQAAVPPGAR